jgi:hypothetical protein
MPGPSGSGALGAAEQFVLGELSGDATAADDLTRLRDDGP